MRQQPKLWDSQKEKKERERENFPAKSSNLRHCQAHSQNKGLSEYQRRVSQLHTGPSPTRGREAGGGQPEPERGNLGPKDSILHQTASRLPVANQMFLGSWTVDIHWVAARDQLPRGNTRAHVGWCSRCAPRKPSGWDWGGDKMHCTPGESALTKHLVTRAGKGTKRRPNQVCAFVEYPRT